METHLGIKREEKEIQKVDKSAEDGMIKERGIIRMGAKETDARLAPGGRYSPYYQLTEEEIKFVIEELEAIDADRKDFVFNDLSTKGTCFLPSDGKVHIKGNIFPDQYSTHPRDKMSVRAVLAHEYYGHRPYRAQYLQEDSETSPEKVNKIVSRAWADEFRASYMAAKTAPNLSDEDRYYLIMDALSRAEEAGVAIQYNYFIRRVLYGQSNDAE